MLFVFLQSSIATLGLKDVPEVVVTTVNIICTSIRKQTGDGVFKKTKLKKRYRWREVTACIAPWRACACSFSSADRDLVFFQEVRKLVFGGAPVGGAGLLGLGADR